MTHLPRSSDFPDPGPPDPGPEARPRPSVDWYLAQLRPNQFDRARRNLVRQGFDCFMPFRPAARRTGRKIQTRLEPLFPGYLFLSLGPDREWRSVNGTYGVVRLVTRASGAPQPVPEETMSDLFARTGDDGTLVPLDDLAAGETVRMTAGPFAGFTATVEALPAPARVGVLLEMMGQAVRTELPRRHLDRLAG